jgi:ubiquinone/menaquinone biosynthesis C-methylase UbiE
MQDDLNRAVRETWDRKADFWDARMGNGNLFQRELIGPASERLLELQRGEVVLEIACGNGVFSRRMAGLGAAVVATDFSARFLELARARDAAQAHRAEYRLVDATDEDALLALGENRFDAAVCNMGLMDMPAIDPLFRALKRLLKREGRFVFSVLHPSFNIAGATVLGLEMEDQAGRLTSTPFVKISRYQHVPPLLGVGMPDEPEPHLYFHRTFSVLLQAGFVAGFVLDGLEEPTLTPSGNPDGRFGWGSFGEIPPVLIARMRPAPLTG